MAENSKIEWCDHTWSPWSGCTKVSPGCANCYAEALSKRNPSVLGEWGKGRPRVVNKDWRKPIRWSDSTRGTDRKVMVFPSLCDWLDEEVPVRTFARFAGLIYDTPGVLWMLLTKRPEAFFRRMKQAADLLKEEGDAFSFEAGMALVEWMNGTRPGNVWMGVSVEDQQRAEKRISYLLDIPAKVHWLSAEPLLGPIDLRRLRLKYLHAEEIVFTDAFTGVSYWEDISETKGRRCTGIDWVVVGGESGKNARACHTSWIEDLVVECRGAGVPVFVKQIGHRCFVNLQGHKRLGHCVIPKHPKGGDPSEWPEVLRVRQWPKGFRR